MKATDELMTRFYQHLGELFYAVAKADGMVRSEEEVQLKVIIDKEWIPLEDSEDVFHTDAAYQIETVFQNLREGFSDSETTFEDFRLFKKTHEHLFTKDVVDLVIKTSKAIANAYHGTDKNESAFLLKLETLLNKSILHQ
ncbi:MAG: hypothetical protein ACI9J3_000202 [Parvicellaceae bacterium]|jgi:hypothetical protein